MMTRWWWSGPNVSQVTEVWRTTWLTTAHFTNFKLGKCSIWSLVQVRHSQSVSFVVSEAFYSAHHPVIMFALCGFRHVLGRPIRVPFVPLLVLSTAHTWMRLKQEKVNNNSKNFLKKEGEIFHWKSLIITYKDSSPELQWRFFEDSRGGPLILDLWFCSYLSLFW